MASVADIKTYVYGATYDSWNRVQTMTYPDGEVVTYHYNAAGQVESMTSNKQGRQSVIVDRIGYDKEGHTVYTKLGNGTETTYTYDKQRERLQVMNLTADGQTVMENRYQYDAVDNILGITNTTREMYWDEDNRLMVLSDNGKTSRYTYNAAGERIMKSYGTMGALRSIDYNKYFVIGLVHNEGRHITDGLYPNHYVQLLGFNRQNYASFWTWGENRPRKSHVFGLMYGIHQIYMIKR